MKVGCSARVEEIVNAPNTIPTIITRFLHLQTSGVDDLFSKAMGIVEVLLLGIALLHCNSAAGAAEIFNETLSVRSLRDGRVSTRFSFVTALEHAVPRSPETLNVSDTGAHIYFTFPYWDSYCL